MDVHSNWKHLLNPMMPKEEEVCLMISPPLTKERFTEDLMILPWYKRLRAKPKEFIRLLPLKKWEKYESEIVLPILGPLSDLLESSKILIKPNATSEHFKEICSRSKFKLVLLVAHHINKGSLIEFADGGVSISSTSKFLLSLKRQEPVSVVFISCESTEIKFLTYGKSKSIQSIGYSSQKVPFVGAMSFVCLWLSFINGKRSIMDTYDLAIRQFLKEHRNL